MIFQVDTTGVSLALQYASYFGGDAEDEIRDLALGTDNDLMYITGNTSSSAVFPIFNASQSTYGGGANDAFLAAIVGDGTNPIFSTYFGSTGDDKSYSVDVFGTDALIAGETSSSALPSSQTALPGFIGGGLDGYVVRFDPFGSCGSRKP